MGKDSKIGWTIHTFNPWWGCVKKSPACQNCYAETWALRTGHKIWGTGTERRFFGDAHWREPLVWNETALRKGEHPRVFCASMADVFEGNASLNPERERLWGLIEQTGQLRWLLLTKRPENIRRLCRWGKGQDWPGNVWLGTTVECQDNRTRTKTVIETIREYRAYLALEKEKAATRTGTRTDLGQKFATRSALWQGPRPCRHQGTLAQKLVSVGWNGNLDTLGKALKKAGYEVCSLSAKRITVRRKTASKGRSYNLDTLLDKVRRELAKASKFSTPAGQSDVTFRRKIQTFAQEEVGGPTQLHGSCPTY